MGTTNESSIGEILERAVTAGLIDDTTRRAIEHNELARRESQPPTGRGLPAAGEAIAYVGASLLMVGMAVLVGQYWDELSTAARGGLLAFTSAALAAAALAIGEDDDVRWRLRNFVGLLSTGALAGLTAVTTLDALDWHDEPIAFTIGVLTAAGSWLLWLGKDRPAQQVSFFIGCQLAVGASMSWLDGPGAIGLAILGVGAAWLVMARRQLLPSPEVAALLAVAAMGVGPGVTGGSWEHAAPLIGTAVAATLITIGALRRAYLVTIAGVICLFVYVPWTLGALFGERIGAPAVLMASGALLLAVVLVVGRRHRSR